MGDRSPPINNMPVVIADVVDSHTQRKDIVRSLRGCRQLLSTTTSGAEKDRNLMDLIKSYNRSLLCRITRIAKSIQMTVKTSSVNSSVTLILNH